jgi:hypothetical protein
MLLNSLFLIVSLLVSDSISAQTCAEETQFDLLGPFYESGSKYTANLAPANDLKDPKKRLVTGQIYSTRECLGSNMLSCFQLMELISE